MSDVYMPGIRSRFNTEKIVEDLMRVERLPRDRAEKTVEGLRTEKGYWQEIGRRVNSLRDSARQLYSFQNPFNERVIVSGDAGVITGTATREASPQERSFTVKQIAQADRFLSNPLEDSFRIEGGAYTFTVGKDTVSFNFRGGTLREFADALNRRGRDKIHADVLLVERGSKSLLIESLVTGAENRLGFAGAAEKLALQTGIIGPADDSQREIALPGGTLRAEAGSRQEIPLEGGLRPLPSQVLTFEAMAERFEDQQEQAAPKPPPPGPTPPSAGSVTYGDITVENDPVSAPLPFLPSQAAPSIPVMPRREGGLSLKLSDGSTIPLPPVRDSDAFSSYEIPVGELAGGKTVVSIMLDNPDPNRTVSIRNPRIRDTAAGDGGGFKPRNAVSVAQDAIAAMDGIEVRRSSNLIDDLIPGVAVTVRGVSDRPVKVGVEPDRESVKEAVITMVGNYNRLMAEINVVTRNDERVIEELSYLSREEQTALRERMGKFSGDTSLNQFKAGMQQAASSPYPTQAETDIALLAQIGVGSDVRRGGAASGYDASRLRGYLEIDEKALDAAIETKLSAVQELFGFDTDGDLIIDSGFAFALDRLARPYVETGGLIALKTGSIDSRIDQESRRIEALDRQLAAKEASLKRQYSQMEGAYNRMDQMSTSLDQFSQQANNNRR